jgi:alpha-glucosidase (family GH31 glycosyl hydrolase)
VRTSGNPVTFSRARFTAPVLEPGAVEWPVYLPAGEWVEVRSGARFDGGAVVTVDVSDPASVPLFAVAERWEDLRGVVLPRSPR